MPSAATSREPAGGSIFELRHTDRILDEPHRSVLIMIHDCLIAAETRRRPVPEPAHETSVDSRESHQRKVDRVRCPDEQRTDRGEYKPVRLPCAAK